MMDNIFSIENFGYLLTKTKRQANEIRLLHFQNKELKRIISQLGSKRKTRIEYTRKLRDFHNAIGEIIKQIEELHKEATP